RWTTSSLCSSTAAPRRSGSFPALVPSWMIGPSAKRPGWQGTECNSTNWKRRDFITLLGGAAAAWPLAAQAQQVERMRHIGVLTPFAKGELGGQARLGAYLQGLRPLSCADELKAVPARYQGKVSRIYLRADAAFAMPEVYEFMEAERIKYAIRLPANQVLQSRIGYLLTRPVGRPPHHVRRFHANFGYQAGTWT